MGLSLGVTKPCGQALSKLQMFSMCLPMSNPRRRRFLDWYARTYPADSSGRAKFMRDTARPGLPPLTKGRVSQLFDDDEPFGERAARSLAERLGLDPDYFERDHGIDLIATDGNGNVTLAQVKAASPTHNARAGEVAASMAKSLSGLSDSRRKTIAMLVSAQIMDGANEEEVAAIDALAGDALVTTNYNDLLGRLFREHAHRIAEQHEDKPTREVLTKFVLEIERLIAAKTRG